MRTFVYFLKRLVPRNIYRSITRPYHFVFSLLSALRYHFPSRNIFVIGVTGTKGKSSTVELINAVLEEAGYKTAVSNTIRFKIGDQEYPNRFKMTMPGRFFVQKFLRDAADERCDYAIIEMTSEGVEQFRHKWIALDMLVFTNIAPEHIESHGSFEAYLAAKLKLRELLEHSPKKEKWVVANIDDEYGEEFLNTADAQRIPFSLSLAQPYSITKRGVLITVDGESIHSPLLGIFNIYNILAAIAVGGSQHVDLATTKRAIEQHGSIPGRAETVDKGQPFTVIVDYAHTPESQTALYQTFKESHPKNRKICVLGNTGGGRDTWKRPEMGRIADQYCNTIILTNEDPYDEEPRSIVEDMARGIKRHRPKIIMDRRLAIRTALESARRNDVVLITGKGTDPYIMGPRGSREPWSDRAVAEEELVLLRQGREEKRKEEM
jgi:UDP-N-acetylmuramoyl-L-alanyl-D-glutamate--2,6-diaminopimelate ligase